LPGTNTDFTHNSNTWLKMENMQPSGSFKIR
jgi:threonine dehydratase